MKVTHVLLLFLSGFFFSGSSSYADYYDYYYQRPPPIISLNVNEQDSRNVSLRIAAREGRIADLKDLLKNGAQLDSRNDDGDTALMEASMYCKPKVIHQLLENRANANLQNIHGDTALMLAVQQSCLKAVKLLLKVPKLKLTVKDHRGETALDLAISDATPFVDGPPIEILQLIESRVDHSLRKSGREAK